MQRVSKIKSYYEPKMKDGQPDYAILGWESEEAHYKRFGLLFSHVTLKGKRLLDVGCGLGNLLDYLKKMETPVHYTGVDILESMIQKAKRKNPEAKFVCTDLFESNPFSKDSFDVIYASGIFNLNLGNNHMFLQNSMRVFCELSSEAVVFNLLHYQSPDKEETYYYFKPEEVKRMMEDIFGRDTKVSIIENYLKNDFTVICKK